jgi:gliding motility-associated-like protein
LKKVAILLVLLSASMLLSAQMAIEFVQNKGQWDQQVKFRGQVSNGYFFIREKGFTILQQHPEDLAKMQKVKHGDTTGFHIRAHAWNVDFANTKKQPVVTTPALIGESPLPSYENYFLGNDPSRWAAACSMYQVITVKDIYPNIDLRYYSDQGNLKYDLIVRPGGDPTSIELRYEGVDGLSIKNRELIVNTSIGSFRESTPYTYQPSQQGRKEVNCRYKLQDNRLRFELGAYDPTATLVIDPSFVFCSFSGSTADNWGFTATYGPDGSMYAGGIVFNEGGSFPASPGAIQSSFRGGTTDMGLIRLSADGINRIWATYIGGSGDEQPHSLVVDAQQNLYLTGRTNSPNGANGFPVIGNGTLAGDGYDIIVSKINATGTVLLGSRKIGGSGADAVNISTNRALSSLQRNYGDDGRGEIILDAQGNVLVTSHTQSAATGTGRFPTTSGAFQTNFGGGAQDAVLLKWSGDLNNLLFASFLGGTGNDAGYVLAVHPANGNIYVAGGTESPNLIPGSQAGTVVSPSLGGNIDGYLAIISPDGTQRIRTSYIGTAGVDQVFGVQFDVNGFPYVMGQTTGNWPISPNTNAPFNNPAGKQFIAKLQPDLSAFVYSAAFGSGASVPNISPIAFLVDRCENVYMSGWGGTGFGSGFTSAGTAGLPLSADAIKTNTDGRDFYFVVMRKDATGLLFGSFFGEDNSQNGGNDHVDGGTSRFDSRGTIYQAICGNCRVGSTPRPNFPVTGGSWSTSNNSSGAGCSLTMVKISMNLSGVQSAIRSSINNVAGDTLGCVPLTVAFTDTIGGAQTYIWNFGDGSPEETTGTASNTHQYTAVGTYTVRLIAVDPTTCNVRDTSYVRIKVSNIEADLDFNPVKLPPCTAFNYRFDNLSTTLPGFPFKANSFVWNFGDGSPSLVAGPGPVNHAFAGPGTYNVRLLLQDTTYCNAPDSLVIPVSVAENVKAGFTTAARGCMPYQPVLTNTSVAAQTYLWNFGDGNTSTAGTPSYTYTNPGTYTVTLIAINANTCNLRDTARFLIQVLDAPQSDFSYSPLALQPNTPHTFTNLASADAVRFKWVFGDGDSLLMASRAPVTHQYRSSGTYSVCLTAYNSLDCPRTACKNVQANVVPLVDVPNAFTPLSGDGNSIIKAKGFGISKMKFEIWNRWGQKVFESADQEQGWNGTYQGVVQPMDVYIYTLSVEFFDGSKVQKKGDITLIR